MPKPDDLIRNIRFPDQFKGTQVKAKAFKPDRADEGTGISVHLCGETIRSEADLDAFQQAACVHPAGLLGICLLPRQGVEQIGLHLEPDPTTNHAFGFLHHLVQNTGQPDLCPTESERKVLALQATEYGHIRPMIPSSPEGA